MRGLFSFFAITGSRSNYPLNKISNDTSIPEKITPVTLQKVFYDRKKKWDFVKEQWNEDGSPKTENENDEKLQVIQPVRFFDLFRFSSCSDKCFIVFATIVAIAVGCAIPSQYVIFGKVIDQLISFDRALQNQTVTNDTKIKDNFLSNIFYPCLYYAVYACIEFIGSYITVSLFSMTAAKQAFRIRCRFMQAVLRQDMAWFDTQQTGDFAARITGDLTHIQDGIGEKVGICIEYIFATLSCIVCAMCLGWKLALVVLCIAPLSTVAIGIMTKLQATFAIQEQEAYATAGAVAEEVLSSIRTVAAFGGQKKEIDRYESCLIPASRKGIKRGLMTSIGSGILWWSLFAGSALAFWYGCRLVVADADESNPEYTGGNLFTILFLIVHSSTYIGQTAPYFEAFSIAKGAAAKIYRIIEREPSIDSTSEAGHKPEFLEGHIRLKKIKFCYPSRPTVPILRDLSMEAMPGETVAVVGPSGCGKSTIVQLLLRFYDANSGSIQIDGRNVKNLNLGWLRDHIGLVGQEPVLFSTTIEENIRMGKNDVTQEEIEQAARTANAHNFIQSLPKGYQTLVGERGTQLSGGQKQRIAIARALVRNPRILLLDEATSALDTESEAVVQAALDEARRGRTTLMIAHRLSTIRTADKIIVLNEGIVRETGTHEELMQAKGAYYNLVISQIKDEEEQEEEESDEISDTDCETSTVSARSEVQVRSSDVMKRLSTMSSASRQWQVPQKSKDEEDVSTLSQSRLIKMSTAEWPYVLIGAISSILMGSHFPAFGILLGSVIGEMSKSTDAITESSSFYSLMFFGASFTSGILSFLQAFMFSLVGEKLTLRLRKLIFSNIITQDISFFDESTNSVGGLCSRLNSDASNVHAATGSRISTISQALSCLGIGIIVGLYIDWKICLVAIAFLPLIILGAVLELKIVRARMSSETKGMENASKIATEAIDCIRTVASLHQEKKFYDQYCSALSESHRRYIRMSQVRGLAFGFAVGMPSLSYAISLYYGSTLVAKQEVDYGNLIKVVQAVYIGARMTGQSLAFTPDYEKARLAAYKIFQLLDKKPIIDACSDQGKTNTSIDGSVHFSHLYFSYPSRPQFRVLRNLDTAIEPGKTVALVGSSGCGKSTCVQLLERFYDPNKGKVVVDSDDIRDLNISNHRSHLALVSQEPVLFDRSIAENIAYGDNSTKVEMAEIISAARQANIHNFVASLPQGYDTPVGDRGSQLSGGQKQRIAIARALVRNPRILLLDEATSALDAGSEKIVQEALDLARSGRTCLVIAHRLSTIQNADVILVLHRGKIVERGTHRELISRKGMYYALCNTQE